MEYFLIWVHIRPEIVEDGQLKTYFGTTSGHLGCFCCTFGKFSCCQSLNQFMMVINKSAKHKHDRNVNGVMLTLAFDSKHHWSPEPHRSAATAVDTITRVRQLYFLLWMNTLMQSV